MFIGREEELNQLNQIVKRNIANLIIIRGRRRIGKSRLIEEFSKSFKKKFFFSGLAPEDGMTAIDQRQEFLRQMVEQRTPGRPSQDWSDLLLDVATHCKSGQCLVVLDEITWMAEGDKTFLPKLKNTWDTHFKKNPRLTLIISGSNSAWIEKNILNSKGFFGRISLRIHLKELSLKECNEFWSSQKDKVSAFEKLKVLSVTGGVPRYLEEINPKESAEQNIQQLCFNKAGLLFHEFDDIFSDLFSKRDLYYKNIIQSIADGNNSVKSISEKLKREKGGDLSARLEELCSDGFIQRDYSWNIKTQTQSKFSKYRITDNYLRFYLKYILPHKQQIELGATKLPASWETIIGLQFENLVVSNRETLHKLLKIDPSEIVYANPFLQTQTSRRKGCQFDYLIQTKYNTLIACEIKFKKNEIDSKIIDDMQTKIDSLDYPKGLSIRPALIHVNGVSHKVIDADYFSNIIDFSELL